MLLREARGVVKARQRVVKGETRLERRLLEDLEAACWVGSSTGLSDPGNQAPAMALLARSLKGAVESLGSSWTDSEPAD